MRRVQTQVGAQVYEWYDSAQAQHSMTALAKLCASLFGQNGMINGLAVTQTTVASMSVLVGIGEVYQVAPLESTVCGTLPQDTSHTILKQGLRLDSGSISGFSAPTTSGQSINYLIEVQYQDSDLSLDPTSGTSPVVLQFYNSSNPTTPWSGPNNSGASSNTFRDGIVAIQVKAGVAATTGSQTTPSADTGWLPLAVVTVAYGQSTITNANISTYPGAAIMPSSGLLVGAIQQERCTSAVASGTADAITASFTPAITSTTLASGVTTVSVRAAYANTTATPTFTPNSSGISAAVIVKGNNQPLIPGDITGAGHWLTLQWDSTLSVWVLLNPATGSGTVTATNDSGFSDNSNKPASTSWIRAALGAIATAAGFQFSANTIGYVKFPSWLGSLIIQWGYVLKPSSASVSISWPMAFQTAFFRCIASFGGSNNPSAGVSTGNPSNSGATFYSSVGGAGYDISWIAVGW